VSGELNSLIGKQPLGMQRGMGLNGLIAEPLARSAALAAEITSAVAAAHGTAISRRDIFARFADRASRATIYRHLDAAIASTGVRLAPTKLARPPGFAMTEAEQEAELAEVRDAVDEIERLVAGGDVLAEPTLQPEPPAAQEIKPDNILLDQSVPTPEPPVVEQTSAPRPAAPEPPEGVLEASRGADCQ
jgi:hypothetical protein